MEKLKSLYEEYKLPYKIVVYTDMLYKTDVVKKAVVVNKAVVNKVVVNKVIVDNTPPKPNFRIKIKPLRLFTYSTKFPKTLSGDIYQYLIKITETTKTFISHKDFYFNLYCYPRKNYIPHIGKFLSFFKGRIENNLIFTIKFCDCSFLNDNADFTLNVFFKGQLIFTSTKFKIFARRRLEEKNFWEKKIVKYY